MAVLTSQPGAHYTVLLSQTGTEKKTIFARLVDHFVLNGRLNRKSLLSYNIRSDVDVFHSSAPSARLVFFRAKTKRSLKDADVTWSEHQGIFIAKMSKSTMDRRCDQKIVLECKF